MTNAVFKSTDLGQIQVVKGKNNLIHPSVVFGEPQHREYYKTAMNHFEEWNKFKIIIGNNNVIREFCAIHSGTERDTVIGNDCFIMGMVHIPHDALIEDHVTITNGCNFGGFTILMEHSNIGFGSVTHQYSVVGQYAMIGMLSAVTRQVPPFTLYYNGRLRGLNIVGMKRAGFKDEEMEQLFDYYVELEKGFTPDPPEKFAEIFKKFKEACNSHPRTKVRELAKWDWEKMSRRRLHDAEQGLK